MAEPDLTDDKALEHYEALSAYFLSVTLSPSQMRAMVAEIRNLRAMVKHLAGRVAAQSELLSRRAEKEPVR